MSVEGWGPWVEHDGTGCPIKGMWAQVEYENEIKKYPPHYTMISERVLEGIVGGGKSRNAANSWNWKRGNRAIRYRVRKPRALLNLIEMVESLPERASA